MKFNFFLIIIIAITFLSCQTLNAQSYTTVTKSCGSCGRSVPNNSRIGDYCPYCGVRWGYENTKNTFRTQSQIRSSDASYYVRNERAYFQNTADFATQRNAYVIKGDAVFARIDRNGFVYVIYVNSFGQVTKGWLSKSDLE